MRTPTSAILGISYPAWTGGTRQFITYARPPQPSCRLMLVRTTQPPVSGFVARAESSPPCTVSASPQSRP